MNCAKEQYKKDSYDKQDNNIDGDNNIGKSNCKNEFSIIVSHNLTTKLEPIYRLFLAEMTKKTHILQLFPKKIVIEKKY